MYDRRLVDRAIAELSTNAEQFAAAQEKGHCVVLAGPGSGKTKTLTTAMARALLDDVEEPRGIACITYNNECALELETRLARLGVEPSEQVFIGTVHSFALGQVISPYARCVIHELPLNFRLATHEECEDVVQMVHKKLFGVGENPRERWRYAEEKRRRDVDRTQPIWRGRNPELADFIEAYENELRSRGLIDFDDMPLVAVRMLQQHPWIVEALQARFPILFVDEYQDLGHALHHLVLRLCLGGRVRLFAVGDSDQSIYGFTGANPSLLGSLSTLLSAREIRLKFNYRCGSKIIDASMAALGEERGYTAPPGTADGAVHFCGVDGDLTAQAAYVVNTLVSHYTSQGVPLEQIAILYRTAREGEPVADAAAAAGLPIVRCDNQALVRRNSRLSRLLESCAKWTSGGWRNADPPFSRLSREACSLVLGPDSTPEERQEIESQLMAFLSQTRDQGLTTHNWLMLFRKELLSPWAARARTVTEDWGAIDDMISRTDPACSRGDMPLSHFGGHLEGSGRLNLSTLHSAKGREFDVVIMFAMNADVLPNWRDKRRPDALREARRLFYVGVTRPRKELCLVYQNGNHSDFVSEIYRRTQTSG